MKCTANTRDNHTGEIHRCENDIGHASNLHYYTFDKGGTKYIQEFPNSAAWFPQYQVEK